MNVNRIFLVGYMGSGKSSVGRLLAKKIGWQFIDLDLFIENRYRKSVSRIFSENGETVFREMEHNILQEVALFEQAVISTGGGAPCFHNNMTLMKQTGIVVYLKVPIPQLSKRLEASKQSRPLIKNKTKDELTVFIAESLKTREVFYNEADIILDTEKISPPANPDCVASRLAHDLPLNPLQPLNPLKGTCLSIESFANLTPPLGGWGVKSPLGDLRVFKK